VRRAVYIPTIRVGLSPQIRSMSKDRATPILCYVTDRATLPGGGDALVSTTHVERAIERAIGAGADWIQVREKDLDARPLEALVRAAVEISAGRARVFVNDRLDVALSAGAAGVHLGERSLPIARVASWRAAAGRHDFAIGASCHSPEAVRAAERSGADYVFFGPVFATPSKASFGPPQGLERLAAACEGARIPVLAIGGIKESNAGSCLAAGAFGIAAIRMFQEENDLVEIVSRMHALNVATEGKNVRGETPR
jgi:thiamine-phosphate pyrophosphorylase